MKFPESLTARNTRLLENLCNLLVKKGILNLVDVKNIVQEAFDIEEWKEVK